MAGQTLPALLIVLLPHLDAGDRAAGDGPDGERPLSDLGRKQAAAFAEIAAKWQGVVALYSSPAVRARETLEPTATKLGLEVETLTQLGERRPGEGDSTMAARGERALDEIVHRHGRGTIIAASHGDIVPATVDRLALRRRLRPGRFERRGQWYTLAYGSDLSVTIELGEAPSFPQ